MNRAVALRIAACGLMGLGAALLIAALLLTTYTKGKIAKVPLTLDTTLVSDGTATAFDPASLTGERFLVDHNVPVSLQQQISVESPSNADVVTLQVGSSLRRTDRQQDAGLLLAMVDTVTMSRSSALAVSSENNPGGSVQNRAKGVRRQLRRRGRRQRPDHLPVHPECRLRRRREAGGTREVLVTV